MILPYSKPRYEKKNVREEQADGNHTFEVLQYLTVVYIVIKRPKSICHDPYLMYLLSSM